MSESFYSFQTETIQKPTTNGVPLLVVASGQSNSAGANGGGPNPASSNVKVWDGPKRSWGSSDYASGPFAYSNPDGNNSNNNIALAFCHRLADETGRKVYLVFDAVGGTSIDAWVASGITSPRYASLRSKMFSALATPELNGKTTIDAFVWSQGEEDFTDDFATHLANFKLLDKQLRAETWFTTTTPLFVTGMSDLHDRYQPQKALQWYCSKVNPWCIYVNSNGLKTHFETDGGDYTHFLGSYLWEMGYYRVYSAFIRGFPVVEQEVSLFYGRGNGPASPAEQTAIFTADSLVNWSSRTSGSDAVTSIAATGSISWGFQCAADGNYSFAFGYNCLTDNLSNYTLLAGRDLSSTANGDYSGSFGFQNILDSTYGFASGRGHTIADSGGAAVGVFSKYTTAQTDNVLFQVGIGTTTSNRKNGLAVRKSGIVEMDSLPVYADNSAATTGGLTAGQLYRTATGVLMVRF